MRYIKTEVLKLLISFFGEDSRRIEHALCVMKHAEDIARSYTHWDYDVLIAAALLHDVGIKPSEEQFGYNNGHTQEEYGPAAAGRLLREIQFPEDKIEKVCAIIGNHHSVSRYDYSELAILKKADALVNRKESEAEKRRV